MTLPVGEEKGCSEACLAEKSSPLLLSWQWPRSGEHGLQLNSCHAGEALGAQGVWVALQRLLLCTEEPTCLPSSCHRASSC